MSLKNNLKSMKILETKKFETALIQKCIKFIFSRFYFSALCLSVCLFNRLIILDGQSDTLIFPNSSSQFLAELLYGWNKKYQPYHNKMCTLYIQWWDRIIPTLWPYWSNGTINHLDFLYLLFSRLLNLKFKDR